MSKIDEMIHLRSNLKKWGEITIKRWREVLAKQGISPSGELYRSFDLQVKKQQSEAIAVYLKFAMYGRFRDMGVGRGVKAYERQTNTMNRTGAKRYGAKVAYKDIKSKRWYNKTKMSQIYRMREILGLDLSDALSEKLAAMAAEVKKITVKI